MKKSIGPRTLVYPTPVFVVGTYDDKGKPNVMTVAWGGICCSVPPCLAISVRRATYTYNCLIARRAFTVSLPSESFVKQVDFIGLNSGRAEDKFAKTGLTPVQSDVVDAPYVSEFPFVLECKLLHTLEIGLHTLFVGEIKDVKVEDSMLRSDGLPDVQKIKPITFAPDTESYFGIGQHLGQAFEIGAKL